MIDGRIEGRLVDPETRRGVTLRIEVDEEGRAACQCNPGGKVDSGRRLPDAALLVDDGVRDRYVVTRDCVRPPVGTTVAMILRRHSRCSTIHTSRGSVPRFTRSGSLR
jgi:hypothetical protein